MEQIVNKVAESGIITLDLANFIPTENTIIKFDIEPFLFRGMILREKDYREALKNVDWEIYRDKNVALHCSVDAIVPVWAYMLATTYLEPIAGYISYGNEEKVKEEILKKNIEAIDIEEYRDKRVVVKGCGDIPIPDSAYVSISQKLRPVVKSLMYGEPCSTVPIYKNRG